jgi:glycosyltransferase involved in cell wall biosynthesis
MKIENIDFHKVEEKDTPIFSILIPSWNNLEYLKICIESIRRNSFFHHQIIVHANEAVDDTIKWLKENKVSYTYSAKNTGVCYGFNAPSALAEADYICLIDDDMYVCPDWDKHLWDEIQKMKDNRFCLSGTLIQPFITPNDTVIHPYNYGMDYKEFNEKKLLKEFNNMPFHDWNGCNWYPLVIHRNTWSLIGGLSIEFSPGMYSDPDFMMKLWHMGIRVFKGVSVSRAYHFVSKTTKRVKKNNGRKQFLLKWGISSSTFLKYYLKLGTNFEGELKEPELTLQLRVKMLKDKIKRILAM